MTESWLSLQAAAWLLRHQPRIVVASIPTCDATSREQGVDESSGSLYIECNGLGSAICPAGIHREGGTGRSVNSQGSNNRAIQVRVECLDCGGQSRPLQEFEWSR